MKPPSANELVGPPPHGLDEKWALKNFLGKTREEAREMCRRSSAVTEDFTYMAASGLCYYLPAALSYLESDDSTGNWEFAHGLMCAISSQVGTYGMRGEPLVLIKQVADYLDKHRGKFNLVPEDLFDGYLEAIRSAEPGAARNGGPAASVERSNVPDGPPSVSRVVGLGGETSMKLLNIQLQPARSPELDASAAVAWLGGLASGSSVNRGEDSGPYVNIGFRTTDPVGLWATIREQLRAEPALSAATIVVCQGEHGWDDYLLLHHFDPSEPLDELG